MAFTYTRPAAVAAIAAVIAATAGCTIKNTEPPALSGPSGLALTLRLNAIPDSISQDGGSQSSVKITAIGPDGKPVSNLPLRVDMMVNGVATDFGTLSARSIVTNADGVASVVYTAPAAPPNGVFTPCTSAITGSSLPGSCVSIVASATSTNFQTTNPESVLIRLVPLGVILAPAGAPTAAFNFSPTAISANIPVQFDASTSTPGSGASLISSYTWDFGDGTSGSGRNPSHIFAAGNSFVVTLTVANDRGLTNSTSKTLAVSAAAVPTATFTVSPTAPGVNETVFFNGSTSTPGIGHTSIVSYRWTFGDGATGQGVTVSHVYTATGTYSVQLTVTDESGLSTTSAATAVAVGGPPTPIAKFTFSPSTPSASQTVVFDASTSTPSGQGLPITDYAWSFGDGTPIVHTSAKTIGHLFGFGGTFAVNLTVTDGAGRVGVFSSTIQVSSGDATLPTVLITATPSPAPVNAEVSFVANVTSGGTGATSIVNYQWDFGDGTPQFGTSVSNVGYTYRVKGTYAVKVTVTNNIGRQGSSTLTIVVQ